MNKTDVIFYLSFLVTGWKLVSDQLQKLINGNLFSWLSVVFLLVGLFAFMLYEKINGTVPPPTV